MQGVTKSHILEAYSMTDNYNILLNEKSKLLNSMSNCWDQVVGIS